MPAVRALIALLLSFLAAGGAARAELRVEGTEFRLTLADGRVLAGRALIGTILTLETGQGAIEVRVDAVEPDPGDAEIVLHRFARRNANGAWSEFCQPDPDGRRLGFPLAGRARPDGTMVLVDGIELVCTSGAQGKCARLGYKPWKAAPGGGTLLDHFNACVRMLRADYCGDGKSATRDGTLIDLYDRAGIQKPGNEPGMDFEAAWSPDGAVCVRRTRIQEAMTLERLGASCPRLRDRLGPACDEAAGTKRGALLFNRSRP